MRLFIAEKPSVAKAIAESLGVTSKGDGVTCTDASRKDSKMKPAQRFTEDTLTRAMENIDKFVADVEYKKMLREFLETMGKQIISTTLGRSGPADSTTDKE